MTDHVKCLVKDCINHKDEGTFIGDLCAPCHALLTTGRLGFGEDFVSRCLRKLQRIAAIASEAP